MNLISQPKMLLGMLILWATLLLPTIAGAAISFVGATTKTGAPASSLTINVPAGVAAYDVMIATITARGGIGTTITAPAGWTLVSRFDSTITVAQAVYYRVAGASEPASYTWTLTSARVAGGISAFRGVDYLNPIDTANGQANIIASTNLTAPSITTTAANDMLVGVFGAGRVTTITQPASMTSAYTATGGSGTSGTAVAVAYALQAAVGASGTKVATAGNSTVSVGHLLALKPSTLVLDHFLVEAQGGGNIGTQTAGAAFNIRVTAQDAANNTVVTFSTPATISSSGMLTAGSVTTGNFVNGVLAAWPVTITNTGTFTLTATNAAGAETGTSNSFVVNPGPLAKLQLLVEGETAAPGTASGKIGTPLAQNVGSYFPVTVHGVDANWNLVNTTDTVHITSSDASATLPANAALIAGTQDFNVTLNTAGSFTVTASDLTNGAITANTSPAITVNPTSNDFNAYETSTPAGAVTGVIKTKVAGTPFSLNIIALTSQHTAINTGYKKTVQVELLDASNNSGPLDTYQCRSTWSVIQTLSPNPTFVSNGLITVAFTENNSWPNVRVRVTSTSGSYKRGCSLDNFAIRPASISVASISDSNWGAAGIVRTLYNTGVDGGNVHKAGQPFTMSVTAKNSSGVTTGNYAGNPTVKTLTCTLPAGCVDGTLSPGAWSGAGTRATSTASYSEAGSFNLALEDQTFAAVDVNEDSAAELVIPQNPAPVSVGRFVPDHFAVTPNNIPQFKTFNDAACAGRSFTYIGQPFGYATLPQALVTAQNAANGTTANYQGTLWKLTAADVAESYATSPALDTSLVGAPMLSSNNDGTGLVTVNSADKLAFARSLITPSAPFNAAIGLTVSVSDGSEAAVTGNGIIASVSTPATTFNGAGNGIAFDAGNEFRYGRLWIANGHGSELLALPMTMETQYWNGTGFVTNTADNCTAIASGNLKLSNPQKNLALNETGIAISGRFAAGKSNLTLNKPSGGDGLYNGSVEVCADLDISTGGDTSCQAATPANLPYLQGRWAGSANYDKDPKARATFGLFRRGKEFIYFRENY